MGGTLAKVISSCVPVRQKSSSAVDAVMAVFSRHGFEQAAVVGSVKAASGSPRLVVV
jgi:hypothetical protein